MSEFKSWFMVYKYQPHIVFQLLCLERVCNRTLKLQLQG
jgi:hypothetical protein